MRLTDPDGKDWFVNNETGDVIYLKGVTAVTTELRDKYDLGNNDFERLGGDGMFGENVTWGIYEGKSFNVLEKDFYSFGDLSKNFMGLQGYQGIETVTVNKEKSTEYSTDRTVHSRDKYKQAGNPVRSYIRKGIPLDSNLKKSQKNTKFETYTFSNSMTTEYTATLPMGEANAFINGLNNGNSFSPRVKGGKADWMSMGKEIFKSILKIK